MNFTRAKAIRFFLSLLILSFTTGCAFSHSNIKIDHHQTRSPANIAESGRKFKEKSIVSSRRRSKIGDEKVPAANLPEPLKEPLREPSSLDSEPLPSKSKHPSERKTEDEAS